MTDKTTATETAAPAAPSKMAKAKELFADLRSGKIKLAEGKTARSTFIATAQGPDFGMTKSGASTYWQNLTNAEKGGKLYPHTGSKKKGASTAPTDDKADPAAPTGETAEERLQAEEHAEEQEADKDPEDLSHLES